MDPNAMNVGCFAVRRMPDGTWIIMVPDSNGCNKLISRIVNISTPVEATATLEDGHHEDAKRAA